MVGDVHLLSTVSLYCSFYFFYLLISEDIQRQVKSVLCSISNVLLKNQLAGRSQ